MNNEDPNRHVLLVGTPSGGIDRFAPMLQRAGFDVHSVTPSDIVLDLVMGTEFDVMILGHPMPEMDIHQLLYSIRANGSASHDAGVLLLARPGFLEAAHALLSLGANRVVGLDWTESRFWQSVGDLLNVAPRARLKSMLYADVGRTDNRDRLLYQTVNVSRTGILLQGDELFDPGTLFEFAFRLPSEPRPVEGRAEVVRRADPKREGLNGIGARFVTLQDDGHFRLKQYVKYFHA
jgi:CheY-like chemotaxis protein